MQLELYSGSKLICKLDENNKMLGAYPVDDGMRIHVIDNQTHIFDQSVEKFELTEHQYETRSDSVRSFLKRNNLGKYNEEEMKEIERKREEAIQREIERAQRITVGSRCKVTTAKQPTRFGTVMYNGELEGKKGTFIGVKFDEPLGVNDGS
jgi:tubulin-folding cofactor B